MYAGVITCNQCPTGQALISARGGNGVYGGSGGGGRILVSYFNRSPNDLLCGRYPMNH